MSNIARGTRRCVDVEPEMSPSDIDAARIRLPAVPGAHPLERVLSPTDVVRLQRALGNGVVSRLIVQRTPAHYKRGYDHAYAEEFPEGLRHGLSELVDAGILAGNVARAIPGTHGWSVQYPHGWNADYQPYEDALTHEEDGRVAGGGAGYDQGYEEALRQYGYSRKYSAIPGGNKLVAMADNGGQCVYCNAAANADVDHIEPLKVHWLTRGAMMGEAARSTEANDTHNLVGACANCNRSKGSKRLRNGWNPPGWNAGQWWPFGPNRVSGSNSPPPYW